MLGGLGDNVVYVSAHGGGLEEYAGPLCGGEGMDRGKAEFPEYGGYADAAGVLAEAEDAVEGAVQEGLDFGGEGREHAPNSGAVGENGKDVGLQNKDAYVDGDITGGEEGV